MSIQVEQVKELKGHNASVYALSKGHADNIFFSGGGDKRVAAWNIDNMEPEEFLINHSATVYSTCVISGLLLIGDADGSIYVVDIEQKKELHHLQPHQQAVFDIKYSKKNSLIYSVSMDGTFAVFDANTFEQIKKLTVSNNKIRKIALSPLEDIIAIACSDSAVRMYSAKDITPIKALWGHDGAVNSLVFHPHKNYLLTGGKDAHLKVWDIADDYKEIMSLPAHYWAIYQIDFHPEGKYFATASRDKTAKIWDADKIDVLFRLDRKNYKGHRFSVNNLLWHPRKNTLLTTGDDRNIIAWRLIET